MDRPDNEEIAANDDRRESEISDERLSERYGRSKYIYESIHALGRMGIEPICKCVSLGLAHMQAEFTAPP